MLLDTQNRVLIQPFDVRYLDELDFASLSIGKTPVPERVNFKGTDGRYYAFATLEKAFRLWLDTALPRNFDRKALMHVLFDNVKVTTEAGSVIIDKADFATRYENTLRDRLFMLNRSGSDYSILRNSLGLYDQRLEQYSDNCGQWDFAHHPVIEILINRAETQGQDQLSFVRTEQGYRLVEVKL